MSNLTRMIKVSADELQVLGADAQEARADLAALIDRTNRDQPKTKDIKMLNKVMDAIPKIYRQFGDVCQLNIEMQVTIAGETSLLIRKSIRRYMLEMRDNLGYESSTFVERMLIDEICLRWLQLQLT